MYNIFASLFTMVAGSTRFEGPGSRCEVKDEECSTQV